MQTQEKEIHQNHLNEEENQFPPEEKQVKKPGFYEVFGSVLGVTGILLSLAFFSFDPSGAASSNLIGTVGHYTAQIMLYLFGISAFITGPFFALMGFYYLRKGLEDPLIRILSLFLLLVSLSVITYILGHPDNSGLVGRSFGIAMEFLFGFYGTFIISGGMFVTGLILSVQVPSRIIFDQFFEWLGVNARSIFGFIQHFSQNQDNTAFSSKAVTSHNIGKNEMKIFKTHAEKKPWFEMVEEIEQHDSLPENPVVENQEFSSKSAPLPSPSLRNILDQLENAGLKKNISPQSEPSIEKPASFIGQFNEDETRFIFKNRGETKYAGSEESAEQRFEMNTDAGIFSSAASLKSFDQKAVPQTDKPGAKEDFYEYESDCDHEAEDDISSEEYNESIYDIKNYSRDEEQNSPEDPEDLEEDDFVEILDQKISSEFSDFKKDRLKSVSRAEEVPMLTVPPVNRAGNRYYIPPEILRISRNTNRADADKEIQETKLKLESVMKDYGIPAHVVAEQRGPIITLYEIKLDPGVKVSRIHGIYDEIKMNLAAKSLRIIAPIPGKSTIGIEIPNQNREAVELGQIVRNDNEFLSQQRDLSIVLGKDVAGKNQFVDLSKMPHLLIAGATGAGKSVYMNALIASLLYLRSPDELRFIMIDPKMVELKLYDGIPHLLSPVITDVRKASRSLIWAVQEMEKRYLILSKLRARDIRSYNERISKSGGEAMPYIVILIDELSDLMMVAAKDVEDSIIRLTQKARAVGIHMIMATQRPSVDVITALIKANCPARISFQVAQKTDSRTILDANGAETLLGKGDMLYKSPTAGGPVRIQAPLISESEIEKIVKETQKYGSPGYIEIPEESTFSEDSSDAGDVDPEMLEEAWKIIQESQKTSTSYVQRRLRIGYNRAANIIETLEEMGYLGPQVSNRPREILKRS